MNLMPFALADLHHISALEFLNSII